MKQLLARSEQLAFYLLILFLPTQLGKHFWPDFAFVSGLRIDYLSPTIFFTDILIAFLFLTWFSRALREKLRDKSKIKNQKSKIQFKIQNYSTYLSGFFVISYLLSVIVLSDRILGGLYFALKILEISFVGLYTAKFAASNISFQKIIALLGVGVIVESVLAVFQFLKQGSVGGVLYFLGERSFTASTPGIANASLNGELVLRPYGTLPHPNVLAGYLVAVMIIIFHSLLNRSRKKVLSSKPCLPAGRYYVLSITSLIFGTITLFLSMSRVAIVLWALVIGYFFIRKVNLKAFTTGVFATIAVILLSPLGARFTQVAITDEAVTQRITLISASLQMIKDSPLLGVGLGNFIPTLAQISGPLTISTYLQPVHNIFLLVAAETGLIGLGIFVWFIWKTYKMANGKWQMANGIRQMLLVIVIIGTFDHYWLTLQQGQLLFTVILGLCWAKFDSAGR